MKKIINWGLIGLGNASLNIAKEFKNIDNSKLLAVASKNSKKREYFQDKFKIDSNNNYSDYEQIFKNKDVDIIFIGLPNSMHEEFYIKALEFNKHVLVEKPLTKSIESFKKLKKKLLEKKLLIEEGTANKFHPFYLKALNIIKNLDHTKIKKIQSSFGNDALGGKKIFGLRLKKINYKKRIFNKNLDGGSILDGGIYPISLLVDILEIFKLKLNENFKIIRCDKKFSKNIDLSSSLKINVSDINIELRTSLIENLKNNFEIFAEDKIIILNNIFTISSESCIIIKQNSNQITIPNLDINSSYFYEIKEISNLLINKKFYNNFQDKRLTKLEKNVNLLSQWFEY